MARLHGHRLTLGTGAAAIALVAAGLAARPAYAIDFDVDGWTGSADTTITLSGTVRTEAPDLKAQGSKLFGGTGTFQIRHAVYDRLNEPCVRCPGTIRRLRVAGRSSYSCPRCQR